jgi:hypothetical protein
MAGVEKAAQRVFSRDVAGCPRRTTSDSVSVSLGNQRIERDEQVQIDGN